MRPSLNRDSLGPAPDLSKAKLLGGIPDPVRVAAELSAGMRCGKCERRIYRGTLYSILRAGQGPTGPTAVFGEFPVCHRADCDATEWVFANEEVVGSHDVCFYWHSDDPQPEPKNITPVEPEPEDAPDPPGKGGMEQFFGQRRADQAPAIMHPPEGGWPDFSSDEVPEKVNMSPEDWAAYTPDQRELIGKRVYAVYTEQT